MADAGASADLGSKPQQRRGEGWGRARGSLQGFPRADITVDAVGIGEMPSAQDLDGSGVTGQGEFKAGWRGEGTTRGPGGATGASAPPYVSLPTPPPVRLALGDPEDAKAAAAYRPAAGDAHSRVLRLLAKAWSPEPGELTDEIARGSIRAGQMMSDHGLRMGRGFRASWGPGGRLVVSGGTVVARQPFGAGGYSIGRTVQILQFDPTPAASGRTADELYVKALRNHRRFAEPVLDAGSDDMAPRWVLPEVQAHRPATYGALVRCIHGYVEAYSSTASNMTDPSRASEARETSPDWVLEQAWRLVNAMWGQEAGSTAQDLPIPGMSGRLGRASVSGEEAEFDEDGGMPASRREAAIARWLAEVVSPCVSLSPGLEMERAKENVWRAVLELLSVRRVADAAQLASVAGLPRLAVLLAATAAVTAQGGVWTGAQYPAKALAMQAALWQAAGADAHMPPEAFTVYQLLGREGFRDVRLKGVIGKGSVSRHPSLDWLRQLGLCLWFGAGTPAGDGAAPGEIDSALQAYDSLVKDKEALPPTARYFLEPTHHDEEHLPKVCDELRRAYIGTGGPGLSSAVPSSGRDQCILARLLALYHPRKPVRGVASVGGALEAALEPLSVTPDVMDYRHAWHLMHVAEALGVAKLQDRSVGAAVAESLRFQLETAGLWEWAVYVALTAEDNVDREATARDLVMRYGHGLLSPGEDDPMKRQDLERRLALLVEFNVPKAWLFEADAVHAG